MLCCATDWSFCRVSISGLFVRSTDAARAAGSELFGARGRCTFLHGFQELYYALCDPFIISCRDRITAVRLGKICHSFLLLRANSAPPRAVSMDHQTPVFPSQICLLLPLVPATAGMKDENQTLSKDDAAVSTNKLVSYAYFILIIDEIKSLVYISPVMYICIQTSPR